MKRNVFHSMACLAGIFLVISLFPGCGQENSRDPKAALATANHPIGKVEMKQEDPSPFLAVKENDPFFKGDLVRTGKDSSVQVAFRDKSIMNLHPLTVFKLDGSGQDLGAQSEGTAVYQMEKQPQGTRIAVPNGTMAILGTTFAITISSSSVKLLVDEGKVRFTLKAGGQETVVEGGQALEVRNDATSIPAPAQMGFFDRDSLFSKDSQGKLRINR